MGKTSTHEFADGGPSFDLPKPPARNRGISRISPRAQQRHRRRVAAGLILGGIGTDTGGSIRGPAAFVALPASSRPMALSAAPAWRPRLSPRPYRADGVDNGRLRTDAAGARGT